MKVEGKFYRCNATNDMTDNSLDEELICMTDNLEEVILSSLFLDYRKVANLFSHKFPLMFHCEVQFE